MSVNTKNWQELKKPNSLEIKDGGDRSRKATFVAEPLERGFGLTLGNALRRVLLSSLQGAAITSIKIENVLHEFSSLAGVREDVTDIVLNVKQIALKMEGEGPKRLQLSATGPGAVKAGDIAVTAGPRAGWGVCGRGFLAKPDHVWLPKASTTRSTPSASRLPVKTSAMAEHSQNSSWWSRLQFVHSGLPSARAGSPTRSALLPAQIPTSTLRSSRNGCQRSRNVNESPSVISNTRMMPSHGPPSRGTSPGASA